MTTNPLEWSISKKNLTTPVADKDEEQQELSFIAGVSAK